jgi:hypothetical protein
MRIDIKQKDLQIGMLEVVEKKGANLRLKSVLMRLVGGRAVLARVGQDKHNLVYHIFTACQMISCKYKYLNGLRGWTQGVASVLKEPTLCRKHKG